MKEFITSGSEVNLASDLWEVEYLSDHVIKMLSNPCFFSFIASFRCVAVVLTTLSTSAAENYCFRH